MPIGKRPLLEYWLQTLQVAGIREAMVNTHFHADLVDAFLARARYANWVKSAHEQELLGTAGTLRANSEFFRGHTTLLIHADNWCQCDFGAFLCYHLHQRPRHCLITMMTFDTDTPQNCGIVKVDSQKVVVAFYEKVANPPGKRANAAIYLLEPEVIEWLGENPHVKDFSTEVLPRFIGRIATWHNTGIHRDIGNISSLCAAQHDPLPQYNWPSDDEWQKAFETLPIFDQLKINQLTLDYSDER